MTSKHEHREDLTSGSQRRPMTSKPTSVHSAARRGGVPRTATATTTTGNKSVTNGRATSASKVQDARDAKTTPNRPKTTGAAWRKAAATAVAVEQLNGKEETVGDEGREDDKLNGKRRIINESPDAFLTSPDTDDKNGSVNGQTDDKNDAQPAPEEETISVVQFRIPPKVAAEQFDPSEFLCQLQDLCHCLQKVLHEQDVEDFKDERLREMVATVTGTMSNFKSFVTAMQDLLETTRDHMKNASDFVLRKIMHTMTNEKSYKPAINAFRGVSLAEIELTSRQLVLNSQLTKANESLQRAISLTIEADIAANEAQIVAEQAAEQARLAQAEYEERRRVERELQLAAELRKQQAEQQAAEAARQREEEMKKLEQRRAELKKPRDDIAEKLSEAKNWPLWTYETEHRSEFDGGVLCIVQVDPTHYTQTDLKCSVTDPVELCSSMSMFSEGEELISNIVHLTLSICDDDMITLQKPVIVTLPYVATVRSSTREPLVKAQFRDSPALSWQSVKSTEIIFDNYKNLRFLQVEVSSLPASLIVVSGPRKDYLHLPRRGGLIVVSDIDKNITFRSARLPRREFFTLQLQPIDTDVKARLSSVKGLFTTSAIVNMSWSSTEFSEKITMTLPVPANPVKLAKLAAARAAKQGKNNKSVVIPGPDPVKEMFGVQSTSLKNSNLETQSEESEKDKDKNPEETKQRRWYMGEYGTSDDDENDHLSLVKKTPAGKWVVDEDIEITQLKIDLVQFDLRSPLTRFVILRTRKSVPAASLVSCAETIEHLIQNKVVYSVIRQHTDDQRQCIHILVPFFKLERIIRKLENDGYSIGPDPSKEFFLRESSSLELSFHNNICNADDNFASIPFIFHANLDTFRHFSVAPADQFLQKHFDFYRGIVVISKKIYSVEKASHHDSAESLRNETYKLETVATHQISIPKMETDQQAPVAVLDPERPAVSASTNPLEGICNDQRAEVLRYVANELGDEWLLLARCLQLKSSRLQSIQRHAERYGLDETQMKLEMLACWFKAQPRAINKIDRLRCALNWCGREDLVRELETWRNEDDNQLSTNKTSVVTFQT